MPAPDTSAAASPSRVSVAELAWLFFRQGLISFGGPIAHLGYFRDEFVRRRRWLTDEAYADLVSLCQFLPGPASSQVVFCLGLRHAGWLGGVVASLSFLLPSAAIMVTLGCAGLLEGDGGWTHGLRLAAVAVVAHAIFGMARSLLVDTTRAGIAILSAVALLIGNGPMVQLVVLVLGAIAGWRLVSPREHVREVRGAFSKASLLAWLLWAGGLAVALILSFSGVHGIASLLAGVYRAGALVFGGGHVVLPWLRDVSVPEWMTDEAFMAGYGAAQAMPGPLFSFAGFVGARAAGAWVGVAALLAIFVPGWLVVAGALPIWERLRASPVTRGVLSGVNAAVVGLLFATWASVLLPELGAHWVNHVVVAAAFFALLFLRCPNWLLVLACAAYGLAVQHIS